MSSEAHIVRRRHDEAGDRVGPQAGHTVRQAGLVAVASEMGLLGWRGRARTSNLLIQSSG
jgi:hypothetical protein